VQEQLDHEKLDVYQIELQFVAWATDLMVELSESPEAKIRRIGETFDHLDRASLSSLFNTAEGNGKRQMKTRAKFFDDARGSATECAACLDALVAKRACEQGRVERGKALLVRVVSMLSKLVDRFSPPSQVREDPARYGIEEEDALRRTDTTSTEAHKSEVPVGVNAPSYSNRPRPSSSSSKEQEGRSSRTRTKDEDENTSADP